MSTNTPTYQFDLTGGFDRSVTPTRAPKASLYTLQNFRQARTARGRLEQTPYFITNATLAQGTYYDGGISNTEPTTSSVRHVAGGFYVTDYCIPSTHIYYQTVTTTGTGVNSGCYVEIINRAGLGITLGSSLDIVIDGATTFKWRKNAGAYTTLVPITTTGVSIDGGNAIVYFLTSSGFTVADSWVWTRTDATFDVLANVRARPLPSVQTGSKYYFINVSDRVMMRQLTSGDSLPYAISVGYRPVYGTVLTLFSGHLVIGGYSETYSIWTAVRKSVVGWSDKNDYHNFIATDINEADVFDLASFDTLPGQNLTICGFAVLSGTMFVVTGSAFFSTQDLGLPIVFDFTKNFNFHVSGAATFLSAVVAARNGYYIITDKNVLYFDGNLPEPVGDAIQSMISIGGQVVATYNQVHRELIIAYGTTICEYQERYSSWHTRGASFVSNGTGPTAMGCSETSGTLNSDGNLSIGIRSRIVLAEDVGWNGNGTGSPVAPVFDAASGASYTVPTITTQLYAAYLANEYEVAGCYLAAIFDQFSFSSTYYAGNTRLQYNIGWYVPSTGYISGSATTVTGASLISTAPSGFITYPRVACRTIALEITLTDTQSLLPPGRGSVISLELFTRNAVPSVIR